MHTYSLFLDDVRMPEKAIFCDCDGNCIYMVEPPTTDWKIVRSYSQFVDYIHANGCPTIVSFDHDLHPEHYAEGFAGIEPRYDAYEEPTGYQCLQWLLEYCKKLNIALPKCYVHSFNDIGKRNMFELIEQYKISNIPADPRIGKLTPQDAAMLKQFATETGVADCMPGWMRAEIEAKTKPNI